jgi:hypothetical protein
LIAKPFNTVSIPHQNLLKTVSIPNQNPPTYERPVDDSNHDLPITSQTTPIKTSRVLCAEKNFSRSATLISS